ncbi:hypothetical protein Pta02_06460 [Planobispora takensis]|uniref:Regulatory protein RecX n=2 Tax=Planobispora takensis TaxID=1367882 RepID=A0A8J3STN0_9ACTN|nr:recombination regulator RecX [Planobispora takensis]GIH98637.1 hypothetical protein Pta02_06460 [Planobispora takensis]
MTRGPDSGPADEAGPRDWGAWPDLPQAGPDSGRRRSRSSATGREPGLPDGADRRARPRHDLAAAWEADQRERPRRDPAAAWEAFIGGAGPATGPGAAPRDDPPARPTGGRRRGSQGSTRRTTDDSTGPVWDGFPRAPTKDSEKPSAAADPEPASAPDEPGPGGRARSGDDPETDAVGQGGGSELGRDPEAGTAGRGGRGKSGRRGSRKGRRAGSGGFLPDGPMEGSPASQGPPADPQAVARAICLRLLTMAPRTRAQLAEALRKREVPDDAAEAVLERFSEVGLIDDEAFAAAWVSSRHAGRGLARRALAAELRRRGVEEDTVKEAVEQLDPEQEAETARRLVERKLPATRGLDPTVRTRRLAGMLARKGYGPGLAFRVIREALENEETEDSAFPDDPDYPLDSV